MGVPIIIATIIAGILTGIVLAQTAHGGVLEVWNLIVRSVLSAYHAVDHAIGRAIAWGVDTLVRPILQFLARFFWRQL